MTDVPRHTLACPHCGAPLPREATALAAVLRASVPLDGAAFRVTSGVGEPLAPDETRRTR
jgi:hypothetical protein